MDETNELIADLFNEFCNLQCVVRNESHDDDEIKGAFQDHVGEEVEKWGIDNDKVTNLFLKLHPEFCIDDDNLEEEISDWLFNAIEKYEVEEGWANTYHWGED